MIKMRSGWHSNDIKLDKHKTAENDTRLDINPSIYDRYELLY